MIRGFSRACRPYNGCEGRGGIMIVTVRRRLLPLTKGAGDGRRRITPAASSFLTRRSASSFSSGDSSSSLPSSYSVNIPSSSTPSKSWERSAISVKNTDVTNPYLECIRQEVDPALHVKTIEDEIRGCMGKALGRQADKILSYVRLMSQEHDRYVVLAKKHEEALREKEGEEGGTGEYCSSTSSSYTTATTTAVASVEESLRKCAIQYNEYRKLAERARWELIVHRQAVGFTVNNHRVVHEMFPIGEALPTDVISGQNQKSTSGGDESSHLSPTGDGAKENKKTFGDQLDWWQKVGRWR